MRPTDRPFRFALDIGDNVDREQFVALVRRAEASGFAVVTGPDHIGSRLAAVLPMLAVAAELSSTLRISPMVLSNDFRHPAILAKDLATMDILSSGRLELGIGTGWIQEQYAAAGITYEPAATRVARYAEAIAVIKGCWSGAPFSFRGEHYQLNEITCPKPMQAPHPPILMAGSGPRVLRLAGREADIVSISALTRGASTFDAFGPNLATSATRVPEQLSWIREGAGDRFDDLELSVVVHHLNVTDHADDATEAFASTTGSSAEQVAEAPHVLIGTVDRLVESLRERRERYGFSYIVFDSADLDAVEPIVASLSSQ